MSVHGAANQPRKAAGCLECGTTRRELRAVTATPLAGWSGREQEVVICDWCLRDRGAAWRSRWRLTGRALPEQDARQKDAA